jgi:hypothetical protein
MNIRDPKLIVLLFNECINSQDIEGLADLMTDDHSLICYDNSDSNNKESSLKDWSTFFKDFPDYKNHFTRIESRDNFVIMVGKSTCSNSDFLNKKALWSAKIENDKLSEWQVYDDTIENRKRLKIQ